MESNEMIDPGDTSDDDISSISDDSFEYKNVKVLDAATDHDQSMSSCIQDSMGCVSLHDGISLSSKSSSAYFTESRSASNCSTVSQSMDLDDPLGGALQRHPFHKSLFPNVPPTIEFNLPTTSPGLVDFNEGIRRVMLWQLTRTTPIVMKKILISTGFKFTKKLNTWIGTWGRHMGARDFNYFKSYQKVNHFPGTFQIGRKDKLWYNMKRMQKIHGQKEFGFVPMTFVLPNDTRKLWLQWDHDENAQRWIVKPPASARGKGIQVVYKFGQLPRRGSFVVQKYLTNPYLINGSKFDLRLYVYVTSFNPLRIYLYEDGLVRFACTRYTNCVHSLGDHFIHLTNSSVNRVSEKYTIGDVNSCDGHKWTLKSLWKYLAERGVDTDAIWKNIIDVIIKTVISCEPFVTLVSLANVPCRYNCHEVFGFDIMLDESLRPWLLEVNISPSLHSSSTLDTIVKGSMLRDLLNIAGFRLPPHTSKSSQVELAKDIGIDESLVCHDVKLFDDTLSPAEKNKQLMYTQRDREKYVDGILDNLTPNDIRHLVEAEDELNRAGRFQRIFPSASSHPYHAFFASPRYHINLLDAWEEKYAANRDLGRQVLIDACAQRIHMKHEKQTSVITETIATRRQAFVLSFCNRPSRISNIRYRWHVRKNVTIALQRRYWKGRRTRGADSGLSSNGSNNSISGSGCGSSGSISGDNSSVDC